MPAKQQQPFCQHILRSVKYKAEMDQDESPFPRLRIGVALTILFGKIIYYEATKGNPDYNLEGNTQTDVAIR